MESWEQSIASSFSLMRVLMGRVSGLPCFSFTGSILVMNAQRSRSWDTASNSS